MIADKNAYLNDISEQLKKTWPNNRTVNVVCHGHSVPSGYFATPMVDTFNAYPHLLHEKLKHRFPFAVINVITTGIGGENSEAGAKRFQDEALCHRPDVITIDYAINDRSIGIQRAEAAWRQMIEAALKKDIKLILMTPTWDNTRNTPSDGLWELLLKHTGLIHLLADEYNVGLTDSFKAFEDYALSGDVNDLMAWVNHPNRAGHEIVAKELFRWFPN